MAKNQTVFVCSNCGNESPKWLGKCPVCNSWNTFYEEKIVKDKVSNERKAISSTVMKLNSEDNGKRKFIMVELPQCCNKKSKAFSEGYKNICEIGKERIQKECAGIRRCAGCYSLRQGEFVERRD